MGIKFYCPKCNGKLNVKQFLAGKRGLCPKCGQSIEIPLKSTRGRDAEVEPEQDSMPASDGDLPPSLIAAAGGAAAAAVGIPQPAAPSYAPTPAAPLVPGHPAAAPAMPTLPAMPVAAAPPDPLMERPAATWYVRHPSGGQYGPAKSELFRRWIGEGRVSGDSLVWREDWPQWQRADLVFPQLARQQVVIGPIGPLPAQPAAAVPGAPVAMAVPVSEPMLGPVAGSARAYAYRRSHTGRYVALAILTLLVLILIPTLVYVLMHQQ